MVYRHDHTNVVYNLIQPFTVNDNLFKRLLDVIIFVDTESQIPLTQDMQQEFGKITASPALIYVITGDVLTDLNMIISEMNNVYNECVESLNTVWYSPFDESICTRDDHYISEQIYRANDMDTTNLAALENYARQYQEENKQQSKPSFQNQIVSRGDMSIIKDKPDKTYNNKVKSNNNKVNLNNLQINLQD